jgi:hypothetical protein
MNIINKYDFTDPGSSDQKTDPIPRCPCIVIVPQKQRSRIREPANPNPGQAPHQSKGEGSKVRGGSQE